MKKVIKNFIVIFFMCCFNCFAQDEVVSENIVKNQNDQQINIEQKQLLKVKDIKDVNKADVVIVEGLNKITAKSYKYTVGVGETVNFERLTIQPLICWKSSPDQVSENKVLLKIIETSVDGEKKQIFYGWMFSSSPSTSSMEHPMYDIRVVDCLKNNKTNSQ